MSCHASCRLCYLIKVVAQTRLLEEQWELASGYFHISMVSLLKDCLGLR